MISLPIPSIALSVAVRRNVNLALLIILSIINHPTLIDKLPLFDYYRYSNYITFNSTFIFDTHDSSFNWILSLKNEEYNELDVFINNLSFATKVLKELTESVDFNNNKYKGYSKLHLFFKRYSRRFSNVYILHDFYENKAFFIDFMLFNIAYTEKINK